MQGACMMEAANALSAETEKNGRKERNCLVEKNYSWKTKCSAISIGCVRSTP
jgi:hypothetical protein